MIRMPASEDPSPRRDPIRPALWTIAALLGIAVLGVLAHKAWPLLHPVAAERAPLSPGCDLRERPCTVRFSAGGAVTLDIKPRGIPAVHPLAIDVELADLPQPERVELDFTGVDMDMGFNRSVLTPMSATNDGVGRYRGEAMLPVCVRARMTWEVQVLLHFADGLWSAPFRFDSLRPGASG